MPEEPSNNPLEGLIRQNSQKEEEEFRKRIALMEETPEFQPKFTNPPWWYQFLTKDPLLKLSIFLLAISITLLILVSVQL